LALAAVLAQPWADVVLIGAATVRELTSNLAAEALELGPGVIDHLDSVREKSAVYWEMRASLPWN
jgi:aryl-alcohol dehydrogenase-like predicted oxidoreductase